MASLIEEKRIPSPLCPAINRVLRDDCMDAGGRAPKVGALGEAWSNCREGQDEGIKSG